jgi:hypothetical protein
MLSELFSLKRELPFLIADPSTNWQTLDVLYEEPRVERVWLQVGEALSQNRRPFQKPRLVFLKSAWGTWHTSAHEVGRACRTPSSDHEA